MIVKEPEQLVVWLTRALRPLCRGNADPDVLSEFVVFLLQDDASSSEREMRQRISREVAPYVCDRASLREFVDDLMMVLVTKEYISPALLRSTLAWPSDELIAFESDGVSDNSPPPPHASEITDEDEATRTTVEPTPSNSKAAEGRCTDKSSPSALAIPHSNVIALPRAMSAPNLSELINDASINGDSDSDADSESSPKIKMPVTTDSPQGSSTDPKKFRMPGFRLVPEDVDIYDEDDDDDDGWRYRDVVVNPCTREIEDRYARQKFDYYDFSEFNKLTELLDQVKRFNMKQTKSEAADESPQTMESAKVAVEKVYGSFSFDGLSDSGKELIERKIKEAMNSLEEEQLGLSELELWDKLSDAGVSMDTITAENELQQLINSKFSPDEQKMYAGAHPSNANGEWFLLPRGDLKSTRREFFDDFEYTETKLGAGNIYSKKGAGVRTKAGASEEIFEGAGGQVNARPSKSKSVLARSSRGLKRRSEMEAASYDSDVGSEESGTERSQMFTCQALQNLHLYDPKFELCFSQPYRIFSSRGGADDREIPKLLSHKILCTLNEFPNGATPNVFWQKFHKLNGYLPQLHNLSYSKLLEYHADEIFFCHKTPFPKLIFPGFLEGITSPELILNRVWHAVMCMVGKKPALVLTDIFPALKRKYGFSFDPSDWGFQKLGEFFSFCLHHFGKKEFLKVYPLEYRENYVANTVEYLMVNNVYLTIRLEEMYGVFRHEMEERSPVSIPDDCMSEGETIPYQSNGMYPRQKMLVKLLYAKSPDRMFVVPYVEFKHMLAFQAYLNDHDNRILYHNHTIVDPSMLKAGMFVMAYLPDFNSIQKNYFRARVMLNDRAKEKVFVYGVDFGFQRSLYYKDIRLMPKAFQSVPAYAIPVIMSVSLPSNKSKWDISVASRTMFSMLGRLHLLSIRFNSPIHNLALGCKRWMMTSCQVVDSEANPVIIEESFSAAFFEDYEVNLMKKENEKKARADAVKEDQNFPKVEEDEESESEDVTLDEDETQDEN